MADPAAPARVRLERMPAHAWGVAAVVLLSLVYALFEVSLVRPYLWPAGTGALLTSDPASRLPLIARPPDVRGQVARATVVTAVAPGSPAAKLGLTTGTTIADITGSAGHAPEPGGCARRVAHALLERRT